MAVTTVYNSYGVPVGSAFYYSESERRADAVIRSVVITISVVFLGLVYIAISSCLPLWQRIFIHPNVIRVHKSRISISIIFGLVLIGLFVIGGLLGFHHWKIGLFSGLGIFLLTLGGITYLIAFVQNWISQKHPEKVKGNGYGLLNYHCLFLNTKPLHFWTYLQDVTVVLLLFYPMLHLSTETSGFYFIFACIFFSMTVGYNWYSQIKFSEPDSIEFED